MYGGCWLWAMLRSRRASVWSQAHRSEEEADFGTHRKVKQSEDGGLLASRAQSRGRCSTLGWRQRGTDGRGGCVCAVSLE
jgi:hypothetical protein